MTDTPTLRQKVSDDRAWVADTIGSPDAWHFSLPDECEFQKYRIIVRQVGDSTKVDKENPHKGRVLRNVVAELLGYSEQ